MYLVSRISILLSFFFLFLRCSGGADTLMSLSVILGVALSSPVFISVGSLLR